MSNRLTYTIATILLITMGLLAFFSMLGDSATMDELSHIPAGYSYVSQKDMRINPEHPPLIKDLAGLLPFLFLDLNFPKDHQSWTKDVNSQWWFGETFLYKSGNDADKIIFLARIPMILILLILGFYVFLWAKEIGGNLAGILALIFYSFCPTFLAHGRYVTTDVGAAAGFFITAYYFWHFLKNPNKKNIILAGLVFGLGQLAKFTVFLIVPALPILAIIWALTHKQSIKKYFLLSLVILTIGFLLIYPVYLFHVWNMPAERQIDDTKQLLSSHPIKPLIAIDVWMASQSILRPYAHYFLGLLLVFQRGIFGHTTYFLGEVSAGGWRHYFPIVYSIKIPLAFHILTIISLFWAAYQIKKPFWQQPILRAKSWIKENFAVFTMVAFVLAYWAVSLSGNLTLGVRHLSPLFPFMYVLVSLGLIYWIKGRGLVPEKGLSQAAEHGLRAIAKSQPPRAEQRPDAGRDDCVLSMGLPELWRKNVSKKPLSEPNFKIIITSLLLAWYIIPTLLLYPHFLTYFNELVGGPKEGSIYVVDSNLDWGQDLKRLKKWVEENNIEKIKIDYFGGGNVDYYFGQKYEKFDPKSGPQKGWLAISATLLRGGQGRPAPGFKESTEHYLWLLNYKPVTVIGNSIFVYNIN